QLADGLGEPQLGQPAFRLHELVERAAFRDGERTERLFGCIGHPDVGQLHGPAKTEELGAIARWHLGARDRTGGYDAVVEAGDELPEEQPPFISRRQGDTHGLELLALFAG